MKIRKAVFPVAGLGTRVLPATKAMPKEMLTIVDKPLIQYVVDEAKEAGIEHFVFVTGRNKGVIEDHFDRMFELDTTLAARGKKAEQEILAASQPEAGAMSFTRQQAPLGLGHAVWCARDIVGDEPFAVVLPDELVLNTPGCLKQMIAQASKLDAKSNLIAVEAVPEHLTHQYGICGVGKTQWQDVRGCEHGGEAGKGHRAVQPLHHRPLRPAARRSSRSWRRRSAAPAARSSSPTR
jgi:UTP--glucose-1-phosphate uridylyltransferase